jgi:hypothetical protein
MILTSKTVTRIGVLAVLVIAGCRGIVGIEDLKLEGGDAGIDASTPSVDASVPDDANTPEDATVPIDSNEPVDSNTPPDSNAPVDANKPVDANEPIDANTCTSGDPSTCAQQCNTGPDGGPIALSTNMGPIGQYANDLVTNCGGQPAMCATPCAASPMAFGCSECVLRNLVFPCCKPSAGCTDPPMGTDAGMPQGCVNFGDCFRMCMGQ